MRKTSTWIVILLTGIVLAHCDCAEELGRLNGELHLDLCVCNACDELSDDSAVIEYGSLAVSEHAVRTLEVINDSQTGEPLLISDIHIEPSGSDFSIERVLRRASNDEGADTEVIDPTAGQIKIEGRQLAEVIVGVVPTQSGEVTATLVISSNSVTKADWQIALRAGPGDGTVSTSAGACPATPAVAGAANCAIDCWTPVAGGACVGQFVEADIGIDLALGRAKTLGHDTITVVNSGDRDLHIGVQITNDGIPETEPKDQPGDFGVFWLSNVQCAIVHPGDSLDIGVDFAPAEAGTYLGEVSILGLPEPMHVALNAQVTGPKACIRTDDDVPDDANLVFGDAPLYATAEGTTSREMHFFISNCGFDGLLELTNAVPAAGNWNPGFQSTALPWVPPAPLAVGDEVALPFTYAPDPGDLVGAQVSGAITITTNTKRGALLGYLYARKAPTEKCNLVATPEPLDFGWVAADESTRPCPFPLQCPIGNTVSRERTFTLRNVGRRDCTNVVVVDTVIPGPNTTADMFNVVDNPNGAGFTVAAGTSAQPITVLFAKPGSETPTDHLAILPVTSAEITRPAAGSCPADSLCVDLAATAGGSPNCDIAYKPTQPPGLFCPNEALAFGSVNIGQHKTIDVKIINVGSEDCRILSVLRGTGNAAAFTVGGLTGQPTIPPSGFITVPVTFNPLPPSGSNPFEEIDLGCGLPPLLPGNTLVTTYTSASAPTTTLTKPLSLIGRGVHPDIDVIPGDIDFGLVTVGCCSADVTINVYNGGDGTLRFVCPPGPPDVPPCPTNPIGIIDSSDPGFQVVTMPPVTELPPGEHTSMTVRWCAGDLDKHSGVLAINSDDGTNEYVTVSMAAEGTLDDNGNDGFAQPLRPKVDVLWVVDDSGSMGEEQQNLADNFSAFISTAVGLDTDYHLGVVNTDVESAQAGKLYSCSGPLWLDDTMPPAQQENQFNCNVKTANWPRPHSDAKEAALEAARKALDYPNLDGANAGFYREDAKLYVLMVTDETDQSDGVPDQYIDYFRNLKGLGNPDLLNVSAISGPPPSGCSTAESNQFGYDAVQLVGGQFLSICTPDWTPMISTLGLDVFNARRQFPLGRPATGGTILVEVCDAGHVNCHAVQEGGADGWVFDPSLNSITFQGDSVPGPGQEINVTYLAVCYQ